MSAEGQRYLDTRAIEKATEALAKVESHEQTCAVRYREITEGQKAIYRKVDDMGKTHSKQWMVVAGAMILILLGVVGFLIVKVLGWS